MIDSTRYRRTRERAEGQYGEIRASTTPDVCRITESNHWRAEERHEPAERCAIQQRERDKRPCPAQVRPKKGQYTREEYCGCHNVHCTYPLLQFSDDFFKKRSGELVGSAGDRVSEECEGVLGEMHVPTRSAMKPQDRRPTPEPALAMATR